jgi:multidrug efflux pump subunit AcrA (membrane-fusion protein)
MEQSKATPADVNKLIEEGGDALQKALIAELEPAEKTAVGDSQESEETVETEPEEESEEEPVKTEEAKDEAEGSEESERPSDKPKSKVGKKIEKLLAQRNAARAEAEEAKAREERLKAQLAAKQEAGHDATEEPLEDNSIESLIERKLEEKLSKTDKERRAAELNLQERKALLAKFPEASDFEEEIGEVLKAHPTLSDEAAYRLVNPAGFTKSVADARKRDTSGRTRSSIKSDVDPTKLSMKDMEGYVRDAYSRGDITI